MMRYKNSIEVDGSTVEEAVAKALKLLNVSRDAVKIKIVCEEKRGLFGMESAKPAKVKVTLKDKKENA